MKRLFDRRSFISTAGLGVGAGILGIQQSCKSTGLVAVPPDQGLDGTREVIPGFDQTATTADITTPWVPVSDRKIRMGLVGYGACKFAAEFSLQYHPNVEVVAVSDLFPDRCEELAKAARCSKKYPSLEEMLKDDSIEAIFLATDPPNHARHCIETLKHGKHAAVAVPAVFHDIDEADELLETVKKTGLVYMMFETSAYRDNLYAMRHIYQAGGFGKIIYSEGEYYHYSDQKYYPSYKDWRTGVPPQMYPTHSNAYYISVTGHSFTEVSCWGNKSILEQYQAHNNAYKNPFGSEFALFKTSEGGVSRMNVCWDTIGEYRETGRVRGEIGTYEDEYKGYEGLLAGQNIVRQLNLIKPSLPPHVYPGAHGGSHGYLGNEFVMAILENRRPVVDVVAALNMTVAGLIAHKSAMRDGETLKIPQYSW